MANEKRLIDANALRVQFDDIPPFIGVTGGCVQQAIDKAPTVDAVEVVHGRWEVELDDMGWKKNTCSICGYVKRTDIHVRLGWNYCPKCGARMDLPHFTEKTMAAIEAIGRIAHGEE